MVIDKEYLEESDDKFAPVLHNSKKKGASVSKKTAKRERRKKERHGRPINFVDKGADEKLKNVNSVKEKIVDHYNRHDDFGGDKYLGYLVEMQAGNPELLAKSLCDVCKRLLSGERLMKLLERAYTLNPRDPITLTSYARALAESDDCNKAFELFEESLRLNRDPITLNSYASALAESGDSNKAFELFEESLRLNRDNSVTLNSYASALAESGDSNKAFELFEESLRLNRDPITLTSYASALINEGLIEEAGTNLETALALDAQDNVALYLYGRLLFSFINDYPASFGYLQRVQREKMPDKARVTLCFLLGQLAYLMNQNNDAEKYFAEAIRFSEEDSRTRLQAAQHILSADPHSDKAFEILQAIDENHSSYRQAEKMLAFHLPFSALYKKFQGETHYDLHMLNRGIYHKIHNEIFILKSIAQRILYQEPDIGIHNEVVARLEEIIDAIAFNRNQEQHSLETIASNDLKAVEQVISTTVHRIVDSVNNELAIIKSYTRRMQSKESEETSLHAKLSQLLDQIEISETALNELKAINEGVKISVSTFNVTELFTQWYDQQLIENAKFSLKIFNAESSFKGDYQKLRGCINEIVENSLKHNPNFPLTITITSSNTRYLPFHINTPAKKGERFLCIVISDNGQGIAQDKKEWIFFPLNSTYQESSGLGLFLVKKTIEAMNGYVIESGIKGAKFAIYLPYEDSEDD